MIINENIVVDRLFIVQRLYNTTSEVIDWCFMFKRIVFQLYLKRKKYKYISSNKTTTDPPMRE